MRRDRDDHGPEEILDERLSAWLDGELDAAAETELRAELEARPKLAARLAQFQRVDDALRTVSEPAVRPSCGPSPTMMQSPLPSTVSSTPARFHSISTWLSPFVESVVAPKKIQNCVSPIDVTNGPRECAKRSLRSFFGGLFPSLHPHGS